MPKIQENPIGFAKIDREKDALEKRKGRENM